MTLKVTYFEKFVQTHVQKIGCFPAVWWHFEYLLGGVSSDGLATTPKLWWPWRKAFLCATWHAEKLPSEENTSLSKEGSHTFPLLIVELEEDGLNCYDLWSGNEYVFLAVFIIQRTSFSKAEIPISLDTNVILYFAIHKLLEKIFYKEINTELLIYTSNTHWWNQTISITAPWSQFDSEMTNWWQCFKEKAFFLSMYTLKHGA